MGINLQARFTWWPSVSAANLTPEIDRPFVITLLLPTQDGGIFTEGILFVGETGKEVLFSWENTPSGHTMELQLVKFGKINPLLQGTSNTNFWRFTPSRAGLYAIRIHDMNGSNNPWILSNEIGLVFYFKLAAPNPGGLN